MRGGGVPKKIASLDPGEEISCVDKAHLIAVLRQQHKLADLLRVAGLARSTFYCQYHTAQRANPRSAMDPKIRAIYEEHKGRYGYRRITAALSNSMAEPVNHKCVQRLMQKMGLRAVIRAKKRSRHVPYMSDAQVPNVLKRDFCATAPNQKWATDVTEFNVNGNKLYLSDCMDLYNGEIVAHQMARRPVYELVASNAAGSAFADQVHYGADRSLGPWLTLQDAALSSDACAAWSQAKYEPQGELL